MSYKDPTALVEMAFQELISTKHLYQPVELKISRAFPEGMKAEDRSLLEATLNILERELGKDWALVDPATLANIARQRQAIKGGEIAAVYFGVPPVKSFCQTCDEVLPFSLRAEYGPASITTGDAQQVFWIPLQCDGCKSTMVVFLVTRKGLKIRLTGRSEFENIKSPAFVPKALRDFYSQAVLAFACGQTLPALFLLRTLIEQHMRSRTKTPDLRGDALCDEYSKLLDEDFRQRVPSLKDIYGKLSDAIHRADPDSELFRREVERIERHFEAQAVFDKNPRMVSGTV